MGIFEIGAVVAVVLGLVEIIKWLIEFILKKANPETMAEKVKLQNIELLCVKMHEMHNKYDADGTPIWYVPRSWVSTQKEILEAVQSISHTQEKLAETMERMGNTMDRIDRRHHGEA